MNPLVPGDAVLCSDGGNGYKDLAVARGLEHFVVGSKPGTRVAAGCYHIQNVNSLHARYGRFIEPFCGPATKNLDGYIRWLEVRLEGVRPAEVVCASAPEVEILDEVCWQCVFEYADGNVDHN